MQLARKRRMYVIITLLIVIATACALLLYALRQNINLYFTPSQLATAHYNKAQEIRIGGWVRPGSVHHTKAGLAMNFQITDHKAALLVHYTGVLPNLFRSGQGVVAQGHMEHGQLYATTILAKHDANYHPPGLAA